MVRDEKGNAARGEDGRALRRPRCASVRKRSIAIAAEAWHAESLEAALKGVAETHALKLGDVMQPVRVALTGGTVSEPVPELLAVVGRDESLRRIIAAAS